MRGSTALSDRRGDVLAIAFLFAVLTILFSDVLFLGRVFFTRDMLNYHYPMKMVVRQAFEAGELLPSWTPLLSGGQPVAANPAFEVFYPPQWLIFLPDFHFGMALHIVVHFYICALGIFLMLRSLGSGGAAAALGAAAFVAGGPCMSLVRTLPLLFALSWTPWILLYSRRYFLTRSRRDLLLCALYGGLQAIVAEPTIMIQTWGIVIAYAVYRALRSDAPKSRAFARNAGAAALLAVASLVVAAAQIIPMLDFIPDSVRSQPVEYDIVKAWSMPFGRPLEILYPKVFQSLAGSGGVQWVERVYDGKGDSFVASFYGGIAIGILFIVGLIAWDRRAKFAAATGAILYVLALGAHTPLLRLLYDIGLFRSIRYTEKFGIGLTLLIVVIAALTADRLFARDRATVRRTVGVTIAWFVFGTLLLMLSEQRPASFWTGALVRGVVFAGLVYAIRRSKSQWWAAALVVMTIADVAFLRTWINPAIGRHYYDPPPVAEQLDAKRGSYRILHSAEWDWLYAMPHADAWFADKEVRWWAIRNSMMPRAPLYWGYALAISSDHDQTYLRPTSDLLYAMRGLRDSRMPLWEEPFMAMSNAWYRTEYRPFASEQARTAGDARRMQPIDFVPAAARYPRYYFADQIRRIENRDDVTMQLYSEPWTPGIAFVKWPPFVPSAGTILRTAETNTTITLDVESRGHGLLVLSVTPHKYWHATLDGRAVQPQVVNLAYQGVEIPPGVHKLRMVYRNPLLVPAALVSLLAALAIIAAALLLPRVELPPVAPTQEKRARRGTK